MCGSMTHILCVSIIILRDCISVLYNNFSCNSCHQSFGKSFPYKVAHKTFENCGPTFFHRWPLTYTIWQWGMMLTEYLIMCENSVLGLNFQTPKPNSNSPKWWHELTTRIIRVSNFNFQCCNLNIKRMAWHVTCI